ncbi:MAG: hypothetical protein M3077_09870 [Candidatus Dormibacteraeota bacterium]|nr:hypothetical protein [Candidatus Dormibacteraeota bacterium]
MRSTLVITSGQARTDRRLPVSGNAALAASALIQGALGIEFLLSGLNKFADPNFLANFGAFVRSSPATPRGLLSPFIQNLVLPHLSIVAVLTRFTELSLGIVLIVGAAEIARRRFQGGIARPHGYEAPVALVSALAGLVAAGLSFSIFLLQGGVLPTIMPGRAFTSAIPVELLIVPLGIAVAWLEANRFAVLSRPRAPR